jgi:hypothetical protein
MNRAWPFRGCRRVLGHLFSELAGRSASECEKLHSLASIVSQQLVEERYKRCAFPCARSGKHARMSLGVVT